MLGNGFAISDAIQFLQYADSKEQTSQMNKQLQNGMPLHEVLLKHHFDANACSQIYFAEKHGEMIPALKEAGQYLLKKHEDRQTLWKLIRYPLLLMVILVLVAGLVRNILLPQFESIYQALNYTPPGSLKFFLNAIEQAPIILLSLLLFLSAAASCLYVYLKKKLPVKRAAWLSKIPVYRFYYKNYYSQFLAREWSFLLKSGFSIYEILHIMESQNFRPLLRDTAILLREKLLAGQTFSAALSSVDFLENQFVELVRHGEKNGRLDRELYYFSRISLKKMEEKAQNAFQIIQPVVFMLIGVFLVAIYLSILFPMFQMIDAV